MLSILVTLKENIFIPATFNPACCHFLRATVSKQAWLLSPQSSPAFLSLLLTPFSDTPPLKPIPARLHTSLQFLLEDNIYYNMQILWLNLSFCFSKDQSSLLLFSRKILWKSDPFLTVLKSMSESASWSGARVSSMSIICISPFWRAESFLPQLLAVCRNQYFPIKIKNPHDYQKFMSINFSSFCILATVWSFIFWLLIL